MIYKAIYDLLKSVEADTYPGVIPQEVNLPFINHFKGNVRQVHSKDGDTGVRTGNYVVQIFHTTKDACRTMADSCRTALNGQTGTLSGVNVVFIDYLDEQDSWIDELQAHVIVQNYYVRYRV